VVTDAYTKDKRGLIAWAAGIFAVVLTGAVGFAHGTLWSHEVSLERIQTQQRNDASTLIEIKDLLREIRADMRRAP
jgi:hypothetical protein